MGIIINIIIKLLFSPLCCLVGSILLCKATKPLREGVTDPTWVQPTIATRYTIL